MEVPNKAVKKKIWIISETTHWMIAPITIRREEETQIEIKNTSTIDFFIMVSHCCWSETLATSQAFKALLVKNLIKPTMHIIRT